MVTMRPLFAFPCLALAASFALFACGAENDLSVREPAAPLKPLLVAQDPNTPSAECQALQDKLAEDSAALQATPQFKAVEQTPAYKALADDMQKLDANNCSLTPDPRATGTCASLQRQAMRHQLALARTKEFRALSQTPEFKVVARDVTQAIQKGCLSQRAFMSAYLFSL
jgi:hypothetical protein